MSAEVIAELETTVARLTEQLAQSAANHNFLAGNLEQANAILQSLKDKENATNEKCCPAETAPCETPENS